MLVLKIISLKRYVVTLKLLKRKVKIIAKANFKYIILSYSSDGIMSKEYIESVMKRYGKQVLDLVKISV